MKLNVVVYEARTAHSNKTGKDYAYQIVEIQQSPERPNAQLRRFYRDLGEALKPGQYTCKVGFYEKDGALTQTFYDFEAV